MGLDIANIFSESWFGTQHKTKDLVSLENNIDSNLRKKVYQKLEELDVVKLTKREKTGSGFVETPLTPEEIEKAEEVRTVRLSDIKAFLEKFDGKVLEAVDFLIDFDKKKDVKGEWNQNTRNTGELAVYHPLTVLKILVEEFNFDSKDKGFVKLFVASVLHDTYEDKREGKGQIFWKDSGNFLKEIKSRFKGEVNVLLGGLTKFKENGIVGDTQTYDNVMEVALIHPGILKIKLADRLHNWRTIDGMILPKKAEAVRETLEFFRPIAVRLGMTKVVAEFDENIEKVRQEVAEYNKTKRTEDPTIEINEKNMYDITPWFVQLGKIDIAQVTK